jgi:hypothetical protein
MFLPQMDMTYLETAKKLSLQDLTPEAVLFLSIMLNTYLQALIII